MARGKSCEGFTAPVVGTDEVITAALLSRLASLTPGADVNMEPGSSLLDEVGHRWLARVAPEAVAEQTSTREAVAAAQADLDRVRGLLADGTFTVEDAASVMPRLRARLAAAQARAAVVPSAVADVSPLLDLTRSRPAWDSLPVEERRALLALAVAEVRVAPARGRGRRFVARDRLAITWTDGTTTTGSDAWPTLEPFVA